MPDTVSRLAPWWTARPALLRFIADLVAGELAALRHEPMLRPGSWSEALSLQHDLGLDSLEFLHVAGVLAGALQMHHSGIEDYLLARRTLKDWVDIAEAALQHHDGDILFATSGSTGHPKRCLHALDQLEQEAQALAALFPGRRRLLVAVPSHHIYGFLFSQLLPRYLGLAPEGVSCIRARLPSQLAHLAQPGDLVVGHPQFWAAASSLRQGFADDILGVSSTAPCPDAVSEAMAACGLAGLVQVYGSSETGGLGWRASHRDAYRLLPYLARSTDGDRRLVRSLPDGRTELLQPQDELVWSGTREFTVGARCDGAVQVGGVNVFPARVRQALLEHPDVADAAVRLMRPEEGARLKAFVVPRDGVDGAELVRRLRPWTDGRLTMPERPKAFTVGAQLPRNGMGKLADWSSNT
ncbi:AMP-binding protein [Massilia sp. IC2-476]|uniref:AMP-binding enzyme n=1 Tax=Massilia sp. IC2-476 TaxID=2887199 RepID=UPI001D0FC7E3|nr:AMP-binding protein [Massilia sp. IC2-476]MCC2974784.1 AMP-binding protein [Massilia sp. IC2-476]